MPNKAKSVPTGTVVDTHRLSRLKEAGIEYNITWKANPAQERILLLKEFEIFVAAGKASGKTELGIQWMIMGNPYEPDYDLEGRPIPYNMSYIPQIRKSICP